MQPATDWSIRDRTLPHPKNLDALARLATGLRFFEGWVEMDSHEYRHYDVESDSVPFKPDELVHRVVEIEQDGTLSYAWGWGSVPEGQNEVAVQTLYLLDDLFSYDRGELVSGLLEVENGIDWLSRLYGVSQAYYNEPQGLGLEAGAWGCFKVDAWQMLRDLRPFSFFFGAILSANASEKKEAMQFQLPPGQSKLLAAMLRKKFGGTFEELRDLDGVWSVSRPTPSTIDSRLKELRRGIARFQYWFEISEADETWKWTRRPEKK